MYRSRMRAVADVIECHYENFTMADWGKDYGIDDACSTVGCIGGKSIQMFSHCSLNALREQHYCLHGGIITAVSSNARVFREAANVLGLTEGQAERLFLVDLWPEKLKNLYRCTTSRVQRAMLAVVCIEDMIFEQDHADALEMERQRALPVLASVYATVLDLLTPPLPEPEPDEEFEFVA